ncbi:YfjD family protein [Mesobacillus subterraneus]|uniref:DUF5381 family protein n=1 Tax=Mesobacillus subterraneus TaxID=285983 RepID=UPI00203E5846|nr:DUF5381 family protein [Mesobacillus subterraneus]MCM3666084.1 YfjD family protein [Mesobacillus subterraneus]MCM3685082.1 YfjD family protein [Mesobacillus subterraneus]
MEEHNIKILDDKVEVVYTVPGAGCMVSSALFGTFLSGFVLMIVAPDSGLIRGFFIVIAGLVGLLFSGVILLKLIGVLLGGRVLISIEDGKLASQKIIIPIEEITDIEWAGSSLKYLAIKTKSNQKMKLSTYNLVSEDKIQQVIKQYVIPNGNDELKANWEKRYGIHM